MWKKTRTSLQTSAGSHLPHDFWSCKVVTFPNQIRCNILGWKGQTLNIGPPLEVKCNPMFNHHSYTTNLATTSFRAPRSYKIRWSFHFTSHKSLLITILPLDIHLRWPHRPGHHGPWQKTFEKIAQGMNEFNKTKNLIEIIRFQLFGHKASTQRTQCDMIF